MSKFVVSKSDYMGDPPSLTIVSFPTQREFLIDFLEVVQAFDWAEEYPEVTKDTPSKKKIDAILKGLVAEFNECNGDGEPFYMVVNCDTEEVLIGGE